MDVKVLESCKCIKFERRAPGLVQKCSPLLLHSCRIQLSGCWRRPAPAAWAPLCYLQPRMKVSASCIFKGHRRINKTYIKSNQPSASNSYWGVQMQPEDESSGTGVPQVGDRVPVLCASDSVYFFQNFIGESNCMFRMMWERRGGSERVGVHGGGCTPLQLWTNLGLDEPTSYF